MNLTTITASATALLTLGSVLAFMVGGVLMMVRARKLAGTALVTGLGLAVAAPLLPQLARGLPSMSPLTLLALVGAIAGVIAIIFHRPKLGLSLMWPAFSRWIIWPLMKHFLPETPIWLVVLVVAPFSAFILIWVLHRVLRPVYGGGVADKVAGTYLVRAIDGTGRLLGWLIATPFQALMRLFSRS